MAEHYTATERSMVYNQSESILRIWKFHPLILDSPIIVYKNLWGMFDFRVGGLTQGEVIHGLEC